MKNIIEKYLSEEKENIQKSYIDEFENIGVRLNHNLSSFIEVIATLSDDSVTLTTYNLLSDGLFSYLKLISNTDFFEEIMKEISQKLSKDEFDFLISNTDFDSSSVLMKLQKEKIISFNEINDNPF